jgi:hypothetical protein
LETEVELFSVVVFVFEELPSLSVPDVSNVAILPETPNA